MTTSYININLIHHKKKLAYPKYLELVKSLAEAESILSNLLQKLELIMRSNDQDKYYKMSSLTKEIDIMVYLLEIRDKLISDQEKENCLKLLSTNNNYSDLSI